MIFSYLQVKRILTYFPTEVKEFSLSFIFQDTRKQAKEWDHKVLCDDFSKILRTLF